MDLIKKNTVDNHILSISPIHVATFGQAAGKANACMVTQLLESNVDESQVANTASIAYGGKCYCSLMVTLRTNVVTSVRRS